MISKVSLGDIAFEISERVDNPKESIYKKFVGLEHLESDCFVVKSWGSSKNLKSTMKVFKKGDLLFGRRNTYLRRASLAEFSGLCSGDIYVIRSKNDEVSNKFLTILFNSNYFWNFAIDYSAGTMSKRVKWRDMQKLKIDLPEFEERKKFINLLWTIEENMRNIEILLEKTKIVKKKLMQLFFMRGIGHNEFKKTKLGKIPKEWRIEKLENIVQERDGLKRGPWGSSVKKAFFVPSGYKIYEQKCIISNDFSLGNYYIDEKKFQELKQFEVKPGDLLMTAAGTLGVLAIVPEGINPGIYNQAIIRFRLKEDIINKLFFKYFFESDFIYKLIRRYTYGSAIKNFASIKILSSVELPIPPLEEQIKITQILMNIDSKIENEYTVENYLRKMKKVMINNKFM